MSTPLWGDFTALRIRHLRRFGIELPEVLVGGTPCQSFSIAGRRGGLDDERGQLAFDFVRLADAIDAARQREGRPPCIFVWENVPGILSQKENPFGAILGRMAGSGAALVPPGDGRWTHSGMVVGPARAVCWRILDAQYFAVAQRRARLFVVGYSCPSEIDPQAVLWEHAHGRRDSAPRREAGQELAPTITSRPGSSSLGTHAEFYGGLVAEEVSPPVNPGSRGSGDLELAGGLVAHDVAPTVTGRRRDAGGVTPGTDFDIDGGVVAHEVAPPIAARPARSGGLGTDADLDGALVAHTLRASGHDASEDGSGRGTPLVAEKVDEQENLAPPVRSGPAGQPTIAFETFGGSAMTMHEDLSPPVRTRNLPSVAFSMERTNDSEEELTPALRSQRSGPLAVAQQWVVRRLIPLECERLFGMPDSWTAIRGSSDSSRYTALGDSMAVPVMRWIGERIIRARAGRPFTYLSVCSGIEAATLAWCPLGCDPVLYSETARFSRRVLETRLAARPLSPDTAYRSRRWQVIAIPSQTDSS